MRMFLKGNITLKEGKQTIFKTINRDDSNPIISYHEGQWLIISPSLVQYENEEEENNAFKEINIKLDALRTEFKNTLKEMLEADNVE